jgi:hypothetical protein
MADGDRWSILTHICMFDFKTTGRGRMHPINWCVEVRKSQPSRRFGHIITRY